MDHAAELQRLKTLIHKTSRVDVDELVGPPSGGCEALRPDFVAFHDVVTCLKAVDWVGVPVDNIHRILGCLEAVFESLKINVLAKAGPTNPNQLKTLQSQLQPLIAEFFERSSAAIVRGQVDPRQLADAAIVSPARVETIRKCEQEAKKLLDTIQKTVGETGIAAHAKQFGSAALWNKILFGFWVAVVVGLIILAGYHGRSVLDAVAPDATTGTGGAQSVSTVTAIQQGIRSLAVLSVFFFAITWSGRIAKSHLHNATVNGHRCNALKTFEAFIALAGTDEDTKNAVLLYVAQAIFAPQSTGHLSKEPETHPNTMIAAMLASRAS